MDRAGVSQAVAMRISGHKTASVCRRYRIVAEDDLREALARTQESLAARPAGTVTPFAGSSSTRADEPAQFPHTQRVRLITAPLLVPVRYGGVDGT